MTPPVPYGPRVPSDGMSPGRAALSVTWAALPFLTLGWATPFVFAGAAIWRRTGHLMIASVIYLGLFALQTVLLPDIDTDPGAERLYGACLLTQTVVGCFHAFLVRRRVFDPEGTGGVAGNAAAIGLVRRQRLLRAKARELAATDPAMAKELRIGRPDLPRRYDDGGLIDVNHAPAGVLAMLPGITDELARRIEKVRGETGGFLSAEELSTLAALPPALTTDLAEYGVFLP
ncbi:Helix-hairpin-helix motif-containing protein [Thermomonospora echinospora]|uniref:Helix-hairpin-helix motif-containing protein n=1 Tax=Thermomonospora echinospora TaxID=1992 RepID=A0A1H5RZC5_9ACTN|nr:helix-hairpin-helix domain-containing protein [Thermomonospora echinospora]SEF43570.1 Helix-hairpin-helix motif-containing protein [Thermomonospora echinospora]